MKRTNPSAVASLVLGILTLVLPFAGILTGIIGIILAGKSNREIAATNEAGAGLAAAGKVCSIIGLVLHILWIMLAIIGFIAYFSVGTESVSY